MKLRNVPFPIEGMEPKDVAFVCEYLKTLKATQAAEAIGLSPDRGNHYLKKDCVQAAISFALAERYHQAGIDAEWVLREAVDNHFLCRQMGNLAGSNQALNLIAKHATVDAFAAEKIELAGDEEIRDRLARARKRNAQQEQSTDDDVSFL